MYAPLRAKTPALRSVVNGLNALAANLSWSWHRQARALFKSLDEMGWRRCRHNPVELLKGIDPARLARPAEDPAFRAALERVLEWMKGERTNELTWFGQTWPALGETPVAYFCAEFGVHNSVPIYSRAACE